MTTRASGKPLENPKSETRNPKERRKLELRSWVLPAFTAAEWIQLRPFRSSDFLPSFGFLVSDFGFAPGFLVSDFGFPGGNAGSSRLYHILLGATQDRSPHEPADDAAVASV
jgi:hypothetical protein